MATLERFKINPFWDSSFKLLNYTVESFNNPLDVSKWVNMGYANKFVGSMCDMRKDQPIWNNKFINRFENLGWKDVGTSYYCMTCGTILPEHQDTYKQYIKLFSLQGQEQTIYRAVVFLEDWASGHYLEVQNEPIVNWRAGDTVVWQYDTPHLAANMGYTPRYTLQITGHI